MEKIQVPKLNGSNYNSWKFSTELLLVREDFWKFVTKPRPEEVAATENAPLSKLGIPEINVLERRSLDGKQPAWPHQADENGS